MDLKGSEEKLIKKVKARKEEKKTFFFLGTSSRVGGNESGEHTPFCSSLR